MNNDSLDKTGIGLSIACTLHCLLLPFIALMVPSIQVISENEMVHLALLVTLFPVAIFSFVGGLKNHGDKKPITYGSLGLLFLIIALLSEEVVAFNAEGIFTVLGSGFLITAHYLNIRSRLKCSRASRS